MNTHSALQARIEAFAAVMHQKYLEEAKAKNWTVKPGVDRPFASLSPEYQASNRAAARRIPDHLALIDFAIVPVEEGSDASWVPGLTAAIEKHIERLAEAEHRGWNAERFATGWTYVKERNDTLKHHPSLVPWSQLSDEDKNKDRTNIRAIQDILKVAGCKAVPMHSSTK